MGIKNNEGSRRQHDKILLTPLHTKWGLFPITVLILFLVFLFSSIIPVERSLAEEIVASLKEVSFNVLEVFAYRLLFSLVMMIPVFGLLFGMFLSSVNGMTASAISAITNLDPLRVAISLISSPEGVLEFLAFSLASAQSIAGFFAIVEKRLGGELKEYLTTIIIVVGLLLITALLEMTRTPGFSL